MTYLPRCTSPKLNVIAQMEFELTSFGAAVHDSSHYTRGTFCCIFWCDSAYFFILVADRAINANYILYGCDVNMTVA